MKLGSLFDGSGGFPFAAQQSGIEPVWASEIEPFPIAVTRKRFPNMKHLGDVSRINGAELEPVDIITFGSPCFPAGTLVMTNRGNIPIEEVKIGDLALTHTGKWQKVTATGGKNAETVILKGNHYGIECTPNHPFYSAEIGKNYTDKYGKTELRRGRAWVAAEEMLGKHWATPRKVNPLPFALPTSESRKVKPMPPLNEDLWYFAGRYIGDGWLRDTQRCNRPEGQTFSTIYLCDSNDKEAEVVAAVAKVTDRYSIERQGSSFKVKTNGALLCAWLRETFGKGAANKHIAPWVFGIDENFRRALLRGIIDSDGCRSKTAKSECWKVSTVSKALAHDIRTLAETLGWRTTISRTTNKPTTEIEGRVVNQSQHLYSVAMTESETKRVHLKDELHSWYPVRSVTPTGETKRVYNLTVENDNSYIAESVVVHNCQDLSVAGKRAGLDGERSGLFTEAIRIIKEMREKTDGEYPTFAVWENVPGAFSSAGGEDFRAVLQAFVGIKDETANVPRPSGGKWNTAGEIVGDEYSVAWRVLDARYWGVPQRRRRIFLVADFRGGSAGRILFERDGLQRNFAESREAWQGITRSLAFCADAEQRTATAAGFLSNAGAKARSIGYENGFSPCLRETVTPCVVVYALQANGIDRADTAGCNGRGWSENVGYTLNTVDRHAVCYDARGNGNGLIAPTITGDHENRVTDYTAVVVGVDGYNAALTGEQSATLGVNAGMSTGRNGVMCYAIGNGQADNGGLHEIPGALNCMHDQQAILCVALDRAAYNQGQNAQYDMGIDESGKAFTVVAKGPGAACYPVPCKIILRRLTPTECARLQGMPDWWVDGIENPNPTEDDMRFWREVFETHRRIVTGASKPKTDKQIRKWLANPHSDSAEYKMWGNGVALPCVMYVMEGIAREMEETK